MKINYEIKLSSGKVIKLTNEEFLELKQSFEITVFRELSVYHAPTLPQPWTNPYQPFWTS